MTVASKAAKRTSVSSMLVTPTDKTVSIAADKTVSTPIHVLLATKMAVLGYTDADAATALGVSQPTVTRWRLNRSLPTDDNVPTLAKFLGIDKRTAWASIDVSSKPAARGSTRPGTLGDLLRKLEDERNLPAGESWVRYGIDKSRYYRYRGDLSAPNPTDIPSLALKLGVPEETIVLAAYRTELWRADQRT
jgi:transcriptional regulator with XRE-family HTH domain